MKRRRHTPGRAGRDPGSARSKEAGQDRPLRCAPSARSHRGGHPITIVVAGDTSIAVGLGNAGRPHTVGSHAFGSLPPAILLIRGLLTGNDGDAPPIGIHRAPITPALTRADLELAAAWA